MTLHFSANLRESLCLVVKTHEVMLAARQAQEDEALGRRTEGVAHGFRSLLRSIRTNFDQPGNERQQARLPRRTRWASARRSKQSSPATRPETP